jgi:hypothetical protein
METLHINVPSIFNAATTQAQREVFAAIQVL